MTVDLRPDHLEIVKRILAERVPEYQVRAFGSRVRWTAKDTSDLDLVVMTDAPLDLARLADLWEAFSESDLPFRVDVVDWAATGVEFREVIEQDDAVIQQPGSTRSSGPTWRRSAMTGEWQVVSLADAAVEIIDGDRGRNYPKQSDFSDQGHCLFLNASNVTAQGFNFSQCKYVTEEKDQALRKGKLECTDVIMTTRGTVGNVAFYSDDIPFDHVRINSGMVIFRADRSQLFPLFLYQILRSRLFATQVAALQTGSAQPQLPIRDINRIRIPIPPLLEQQAIACILGTLDDRIELNRRMNETLEGIARAIFKSWFVDFDPVRAKAAGEQPPGLAPHIADLFPDAFEASELGETPKGWNIGTLGMIAIEVRDIVQPAEISPGTPYIALKHMPRHCIALNSWDKADDIASAKLRFKGGDILFGKLRPYFHKVGPAPLDGVCSTDIVVCRPQDSLWQGLSLGHMSSDAFVAYTDSGSTGTKMPRTNWRHMSAFRIALPPSGVAAQFAKVVRPTIDRIQHSIFQQQNLAALRDTLLPKLISGQVRVPDAEQFLEGYGL